jgi:hypothetical protein
VLYLTVGSHYRTERYYNFMVESILIIVFALVLFVYWFRYTVLLLLNEERKVENRTVIDQLSLPATQRSLREAPGGLALDPLHEALERDYRVLAYLLDHAAAFALRPIERLLLMLDYRIMRIWYRLVRNTSSRQSHRALEQMTAILTHVAYRMGQSVESPSRAF